MWKCEMWSEIWSVKDVKSKKMNWAWNVKIGLWNVKWFARCEKVTSAEEKVWVWNVRSVKWNVKSEKYERM